MSNLRENKPTADILMVSMRAMGYSFESAIADIIDNSVGKSLNAALSGRGGGKPDMVQGFVAATKEQIEEFWKNI